MNTATKREPRAIQIIATFTVRNVQASDFDEAKEIAHTFAKPYLVGWPNRNVFCQRELDGNYTVDFKERT